MPDFSETLELQQRLAELTGALAAMTDEVGLARHVREYDSDRRKRVLAIAAHPLIVAGASSAAADTEARAGATYGAAMKTLGKELVAAEKVIARWEAVKIQIEVARSLLSMQKSTLQNL